MRQIGIAIFLTLMAQTASAEGTGIPNCDQEELDYYIKNEGTIRAKRICGSLIPVDGNRILDAEINPVFCGGKNVAERRIATTPPSTLSQSETYTSSIAGEWVLSASGDYYTANWKNGANARIELIEFTPNLALNSFDMILLRKDTSGVSNGLTACYTGVYQNGRITNGQVSWVFPDGRKAAGNWQATAP